MSVLTKDVLFLFALILASFLSQVECACQSMDASWDPDRGPLITQPSKSDPGKVMINWSNVIKNQRCVDEYSLWVWLKGTPKERGRKLPIPSQDAVSFIAEVDACVEYSFQVEFLEKNTLWAPVTRGSAISHFRTEAIPQLKSRDKNLFIVGYYFDPTKGLHDLSKVSIKFPKKILEHANCIKHLEIKGNLDLNALSANQGYSIAGAISGQPAKPAKGAPPAINNTLANQVPILAAEQMYPDHIHDHGWHGRAGYVPPGQQATTTPAPGKKRTKRFLGKKETTTTAKPPIAGAPLPQSLTATVPPPFLFDTIEAVVEGVDACKPYIFSIKIYSPRNAVMGEIEGLKLLPLNQVLDYHPPSLRSLFQIDVISTGQPTIKWQQGLGVPAACLPTFFEAVDLHMQRLEDDITYHVNQEYTTKLHVKHFSDQLTTSQRSTLTHHGCKCNSSVIRLSSSDPITLSKIPHLLGLYHFDSEHQGKPFYRMPSKHLDREPDFLIPPSSTPPPHHPPHPQQQSQPQPQKQPQPQSPGYGTRVKRFIGKIPGSPTGSNTNNPYDAPPAYPPPPTPQPVPMWSVPTTTRSTTANWFFPTPPPTVRPGPINIPIATQPPVHPTTGPYPQPGYPGQIGQPGQSSPHTPGRTEFFSGGQSPPPISSPMKVAFFLYWDPLEKAWLMSNILGGSLPWIKSQKNSPLLCPADPGNLKTWSYEDRARPGNWISDPSLKFECVL